MKISQLLFKILTRHQAISRISDNSGRRRRYALLDIGVEIVQRQTHNLKVNGVWNLK